jgi:hypothetical protein
MMCVRVLCLYVHDALLVSGAWRSIQKAVPNIHQQIRVGTLKSVVKCTSAIIY